MVRRLITAQKLHRLKTKYLTLLALNKKATWAENKAHNITNFVTTAALNAKAKEFESKISDITNLAIKTALNMKAT